MTKHDINFSIELNDDRIREKIENDVYDQIINDFEKEAKKSITRHVYGGLYGEDKVDWSNLLKDAVNKLIEENKEEIIEASAKKLCDSFKHSKPFKEIMMETFLNKLGDNDE